MAKDGVLSNAEADLILVQDGGVISQMVIW
jgi:hypothetical protein